MDQAFVIDNRKCIGCHACSTACKSENEVPLGVHRTWVKYVEHGRYPDVRRTFQVTRCNHCANPPCVRICPVSAMIQRDDGIVDFDKDRCIGCKACLQACPYDAIYVDPDGGTAAKCHMCAHRVDLGLEPACVVVCPEHAILFGDLDDPGSEVARAVATHPVTVRKPEQGTAPKLFYVEGDAVAMHPTATPPPNGFLWSERQDERDEGGATAEPTQGLPPAGPIHIGRGTTAEHMVQVAYNAQHRIPWHWPVPAYLVTKGIGAGVLLVLTLLWGLRLVAFDPTTMGAAGALSVAGIVAGAALLVVDLERPTRFLRILTMPQWRSWLVRGAFLLIAFATVSGLWWAWEAAAFVGWIPAPGGAVRTGLSWVTFPLAIGAAVYTAFLFAQAEGRDLWQSPLLPVHLLVQAVTMGGAGLLLLAPFVDLPPDVLSAAGVAFVAGLVLDLGVIFLGEFGIPHASEVAARAAHAITHGRHRRAFWWGAIGIGHGVPLALVAFAAAPTTPVLGFVAALAAIAGLYFYEHAFVMAPQEVPNS